MAKKFVERAALKLWCTHQLDKWQLTSELNQLWKATRKSGRQYFLVFFPLSLSLTPYAGGQQLILVVFTFRFISLPFFFGFFFFSILPSISFDSIFFCFMSVGRVYAVKKKTASRLTSWPRTHKFAQFQQSRSLVVCCVCATLERTTRRERKKKKHVGIRSALVHVRLYVNHFIRAPHFLFIFFFEQQVFFVVLPVSYCVRLLCLR